MGVALGAALVAGQEGASAGPGRQLAGTWAVSVDPDGEMPPAFRSTILYTDSGSLVETTMNRPPENVTAGLGTWERLGDGRFAVTLTKYRFVDGEFVGTVLVEETAELAADGDSYVARATTTLLTPSGGVERSFSSVVTAERV